MHKIANQGYISYPNKKENKLSIYKKLLENSVIFAIGNLGSKLISILLVPLYTYYLTTNEYGTVDIITTTTSLLLPILTLSIYDAVLRFTMDKKYDQDSVITNGIFITIVCLIVLIFIYPILSRFNVMDGMLSHFIIILILQAFQSIFSQFVRSIGEVRIFAYNGLLMTLVNAIMNIILLVWFPMGISGYLISIIISNFVSILYLFFKAKIHQFISIRKINKELAKNMLIYSIPLMPNSFMWWITNASNRYFIKYFVGVGANGLFAVANKIPSLLSILNNIFFQAWQMSAIEEFESKDKSKFYSTVFKYFSMVMFIGASLIIVILKISMKFIVAPEFYTSWQYVPFLLLGVIFSSFSSFLGTNYIAAQQTRGIFRTSIYAALISFILNLILMPIIGTYGAGISTTASFFTMWIVRTRDTQRFIKMRIDMSNITGNIFILLVQISVLYLNFNSVTEFKIEIILLLVLLTINKDLFELLKKILGNRHNKRMP